MQNKIFLTANNHILTTLLLVGMLVFGIAAPLAAFQPFGDDSNGARGIDFVVINLTERDVTVRIDCEYSLVSDTGLMPRFGKTEIDADGESDASEYVEPESIDSAGSGLTDDSEESANNLIMPTNSDRTLLIGSISRLKFRVGTSSNGRFVPKNNVDSGTSGSGNMSNSTTTGPNNGQAGIAVYDNGYGKSSWGLIQASDTTSWNYSGALGQKYENNVISYFPVIYVIYDSQKDFDTVKDDFKTEYNPQPIGNVFYPEQLLREFIYVQNDFLDLFHDSAPKVPRNKLFLNKGEAFERETLFRGEGEKVVTPSLFGGN